MSKDEQSKPPDEVRFVVTYKPKTNTYGMTVEPPEVPALVAANIFAQVLVQLLIRAEQEAARRIVVPPPSIVS